MDNEVAGPGEIFVCIDCGRLSKDRHGHHKVHSGWSRTCSLNAVRYRQSDLHLDHRHAVVGFKMGAEAMMVALPN